MKRIILLLLIFSPVVIKAQSTISIGDTMTNGTEIDNDTIIKCSNLWRVDKNGCLKFRDDNTRLCLEKFFGRAKKWESTDIIKIWGEPNYTYTTETKIIYGYFYYTICDNDVIRANSDKSTQVIEYNFNNKEIVFTVEIE
jgi:hypothetical protein